MIDSKYLVVDRPLWEGRQRLYRFENNFGASVVRHNTSYGGKEGLWELAVIKWSEEPIDPDYDFGDAFDPGNTAWGIVYDTLLRTT